MTWNIRKCENIQHCLPDWSILANLPFFRVIIQLWWHQSLWWWTTGVRLWPVAPSLKLHPIDRQRLGQRMGRLMRTSVLIRKKASLSMTKGLRKSNRSLGDVCSWTSTLSRRIRYPPLTEDQTISMSYWFHSRGCHFSSSESSVSHMQKGNSGRIGGVLSCLLAQQFNIILQKNVGVNQIRELFIILNTVGFSELSCPTDWPH